MSETTVEPGPGTEPEPDADPDPEPEPDADPDPDPEPEPEPAAAPPSDKAMRAFETECRRHERELAKVMGADFALMHFCEACNGVGFSFTPPDTGPQFANAPDKEMCPDCNGLGDVLTGAVTERGKFAQCGRCAGFGYVQKTVEVPPFQLAPVPTTPEPQISYSPPPGWTLVPVNATTGYAGGAS